MTVENVRKVGAIKDFGIGGFAANFFFLRPLAAIGNGYCAAFRVWLLNSYLKFWKGVAKLETLC